jgi:hypothetical protein
MVLENGNSLKDVFLLIFMEEDFDDKRYGKFVLVWYERNGSDELREVVINPDSFFGERKKITMESDRMYFVNNNNHSGVENDIGIGRMDRGLALIRVESICLNERSWKNRHVEVMVKDADGEPHVMYVHYQKVREIRDR